MALRTMAAKLKEKIPAAVQRVLASSRAPATSSRPPAGLDHLDAEINRLVQEFVKINRKNRRDDALACCAGFGMASVTLSLGIRRLDS